MASSRADTSGKEGGDNGEETDQEDSSSQEGSQEDQPGGGHGGARDDEDDDEDEEPEDVDTGAMTALLQDAFRRIAELDPRVGTTVASIVARIADMCDGSIMAFRRLALWCNKEEPPPPRKRSLRDNGEHRNMCQRGSPMWRIACTSAGFSADVMMADLNKGKPSTYEARVSVFLAAYASAGLQPALTADDVTAGTPAFSRWGLWHPSPCQLAHSPSFGHIARSLSLSLSL